MSTSIYPRTIHAGSIAALRSEAFDYFTSQSAVQLSYNHHPPIGALDFQRTIIVVALGFPERWLKNYLEQRYYDVDPIVRLAMTSTRPFWWRDIAKLTRIEPQEEKYLRESGSIELGHGLAVPVFGPHGRNGFFGVGFGESKPEFSNEDISNIQWSCELIHLRYCELLASTLPNEVKLSQRERSVLRLVARGYTNTQISEKLCVTPKTVATYISRSFDKLEANDRMTAALRALAMGLLD